MITLVQPVSVVGLTQASRVMPVVRSRRLLSATVTQLLVPLNIRAPPNLPAEVQEVLLTVPVRLWPEESLAVVPAASSKPQAPTRPATTVALETVTMTSADVVALPAAS